ncbi:hypothetical protein MUK42_02058 [Musa troglodytarum]|uniref:Uncharacterized protein n=1 Tax=Musa troglodytarum TaxID=320322 RepID=A0A9E7FU20_9LILI|nr:hypothetical protein MUK42_02058 [Musa troglodytarum]
MGKGQRLEEELDGHLRSLSPMEDDTNFGGAAAAAGVSGTSLEASKMKEKGVVDATILIWSGVGGTSFEASKMKEKGVVDATMRLKFECLISHQQPPHKLLP